MIAADFLRSLIAIVPYEITHVLTDNGIQLTNRKRDQYAFSHIFDRVCCEHDIEHRLLTRQRLLSIIRIYFNFIIISLRLNNTVCLIAGLITKVNHPWTNGQVERMNRTIKEATVKRYHYGSHERLKAHLQDFLNAYNFAKRLKALKGLTPYEFVCKNWTTEPQRFNVKPYHHTLRLNNTNKAA